MTKDEFIGKMQMAYFGDKNALEECTQEYIKIKKLYKMALEDDVKTSKRKIVLEQALDEIEKYLKNDIESCNSALSNLEHTIISKHELLKNEKQKDIDVLRIIQKAKGDVKNENNNI